MVARSAGRAGPPDDDEAVALARRLTVVVGQVTRRIRPGRSAADGTTLAAGHFSLLATLDREGPAQPGVLAATERVSRPAMTRMVDTLEERGHVVRQPGGDDGRTREVALTAAGRAALREVQAERADTVAGLLAELDPEDRAAVAAALPALERLAALARRPR